MSLDAVGGPAGAWLMAALVLGIAELVAPGVFLVFLAIAAAITGIATFALPDLSTAAQLGSFAVWSGVTVLIGRRWYRDYPVATSDPLLNDRAGRLAGQIATVATAIEAGCGRVRIGDGEWPAAGPDAAVGTRVRIVRVDGGIARVELVD